MTSDNVNTLYQNSPEWKAQMDAVAKAALDKGKAEAMQDQANRSADEAKLTFKFPTGNIGSPSSSGNNIANATPIPLPAQYNKSNTAVINTPVKQTTTTTNSTAAQPTTKQDTETTATPAAKREPLISSNLDKDSYQNRPDINNRDIIADAKKKGYTADEADAELKRLEAKTDYSKDMAKAYGKYWNITKEQYWDPKGPTAQQLADSGVSAEKVASLYEGVPEEKKGALYKAYPSLKPAAKPAETTDTSTSETTAAPAAKREPLISSNLNKDSYQTSNITNKDIIADAKKKGYTAEEADAELKRLEAKTDYSKDMAKAYGKYWNITPEQYWDPNNSPTAAQLAESGMTFEDALKLYVGKEDKLPTLYKAYGKEMPKSNETETDDTPITKPTDTPNATAQNIANGINGAMSAASGTISPKYIDERGKKNIANYKGNSEQWKQEDIKPVKNLIQSYADGDIDGNTFVYYMSDWIGTGLRNASHFTPGAYGGNKTAETSKWNTMQQDLQNKQAQLAYDTKSADTKNMQSIANSGATATQNAANFVGAGGAEKAMEQWGKIMDPSLDAKGKMAALKEDASSGIDPKQLVNGLLVYNTINGQGTGQVVSTLAMLIPEEKRSEFIDKATDALGKGAD